MTTVDVNTLPNKTEDDRAVILKACNGIIWAVINRGTQALSGDDLDDLYSSALEAANRAIGDWTASGGGSIATLVHRYVVQARRDYMRKHFSPDDSHNKQEAFEREAVSFDGWIGPGEENGTGRAEEREHRDHAIGAMEITIDMARNDGIISDREYRVIGMWRRRWLQREIAEQEGICAQRVHQIIGDAVRKIRKHYRTAE